MKQNPTFRLFDTLDLVIERILSVDIENILHKTSHTMNLILIDDIAAMSLVSSPILLLTLRAAVQSRSRLAVEVVFASLAARGSGLTADGAGVLSLVFRRSRLHRC
jgi:hypothetical protein